MNRRSTDFATEVAEEKGDGETGTEAALSEAHMADSKRIFPLLRWFTWSLMTWFALADAIYALTGDLEKITWHWGLVFTMPLIAVLCAWRALKAAALHGRWARVIFWIPASGGIVLVVILFQGQAEALLPVFFARMLGSAIAMPVLGLILVGYLEARAGNLKATGFQSLVDVLAGTACFAALVAASYFIWLKAYIEPLRWQAEQCWAEIGRPMDEFEKNLRPVAENESLRDLTRDLKPFGVVTFYKTGSGDGRVTAENTIKVPPDVFDYLFNMEHRAGAPVNFPAKAAASLDASTGDFNTLYDGILRRDPPEWEQNLADGFSLLVPNYLTSRILAQWVAADAYHRLEKGDEKRAADAVAAEFRLSHAMGKQPILVSQMIEIAIEGLFAPVQARLPEDPASMRQLTEDVENQRRQFQNILQAEAWEMMHTLEKTHPKAEDMAMLMGDIKPLPKWARKRLAPWCGNGFLRLECSRAWLYQADIVKICERVHELADTDLGESEFEQSEARHPSILIPNVLRAWLRINCVLLIREQAEMIRMARSRMQSGKSGDLGQYTSVVIPGSKWIAKGDAATHSVSLELSPRPRWTTANEVVDDNFWLLPLAGNKSWQLQPAVNKM